MPPKRSKLCFLLRHSVCSDLFGPFSWPKEFLGNRPARSTKSAVSSLLSSHEFEGPGTGRTGRVIRGIPKTAGCPCKKTSLSALLTGGSPLWLRVASLSRLILRRSGQLIQWRSRMLWLQCRCNSRSTVHTDNTTESGAKRSCTVTNDPSQALPPLLFLFGQCSCKVVRGLGYLVNLEMRTLASVKFMPPFHDHCAGLGALPSESA